jgi:hypothetical protein
VPYISPIRLGAAAGTRLTLGAGSYAGPGGTTSASLGATASGPGNPMPLAPATLQRQYETSGGQPQDVGEFVQRYAPPGRSPAASNTAPYYPPTLSPEPTHRC